MKQKKGGPDKFLMVLYGGSYDRVNYALSIAMTVLAMGTDTHILFANGALKRLVKGHTDDIKEATDEEMETATKKGLANGSIEPISQQLVDAKEMGLKIYACVNAMAVPNISRNELIKEVDEPMGLATFLTLAKDAATTLFV